jgi:enoyl-CoA hydratase/carnithine racemase
MPETILIEEPAPGVAAIVFNRPEVANAPSTKMGEELYQAWTDLKLREGLRCVILRGEGKHFQAGADLKERNGMTDEAWAEQHRLFEAMIRAQLTIPVPVIAAVHGVAFGGGIQIALGADIRFVAPDARLSIMEIKWGIIPDMTVIPMLSRLVPVDVAKELAYTGRIISGEEAAALGLATHVSADPLEDALALAREIAGKNPAAVRAIKHLVNEAPTRSLRESFVEESRLIGTLIGTPNQLEAVMAEMEKRPPAFLDE